MTPTDKPCLPGCREDSHLRYGEGGVEYLSGPIRVVTGMIHAPNCPNAPNAPKEPAAPRCVLDCRFTPLGLNPAVYHAPGCSEADAWCEECKKAKDACICPKRPAPPPEPTTPEAKSADFEWDWAEGRARAYTLETAADRGDRNLGRAYLALRAELAAKDEKLRGLDYLYGELGNQNSFLRAELAEARAEIERLGGLTNLHTVQLSEGRAELAAEKAAREKAEAERDELALLTVPSDEDAQVAGRLRIAEARVAELEDLLVSALRWEHGPIGESKDNAAMAECGDNGWNCCSRKPWHSEARAILAARSAKGGAK